MKKSQNPQCEGMNQGRILFNAKAVSRHHSLYCILDCGPHQKLGEYILDSDSPRDTSARDGFSLSPNEIHTSKPNLLNHCETASIVGGIPFSLSGPGGTDEEINVENGHHIQRIVQANDVFLEFLMRFRQADNNTINSSFCLMDKTRHEPDLVVSAQDSRVQFHITNKICRQYGLTHMPFDGISVNEIKLLFSIICSAADFYWYLNHSNIDKSTYFSIGAINVQCLKLIPSGRYNSYLEQILVPDPKSKDLNSGGSIFINVDEEAIYGFRITNTSEISLYAAFFYFDASDLSIGNYNIISRSLEKLM